MLPATNKTTTLKVRKAMANVAVRLREVLVLAFSPGIDIT
jgi:hypothetical protein